MSYPSDWMHHNFLDDSRIEIPPPTTTDTSTAAAAMTSRSSNPSPDHGRGARPIRRRSRASRRTPTTLLNTDTANFRAMVQQFTGSPAATAAAATSQFTSAVGMFNFTQHIAGNLPPSMYPVQYPNQMQQQDVYMLGDMHGRGGSGGGDAAPGSSSTNENRDYNDYML